MSKQGLCFKMHRLARKWSRKQPDHRVLICCMEGCTVEGVTVDKPAKIGFTAVRIDSPLQVIDWEAEPQVRAFVDKGQVVNIDNRNLIYLQKKGASENRSSE